MCYGVGVLRYLCAAAAAVVTFPCVWFAVRALLVLVGNAAAKAREDFSPAYTPAPSPWPVTAAVVSSLLAAWLVLRRR